MKKQNKGITLIALVVTIVILLILAGITIAALTGDNGLIGKTGEAKKQTEISEGLEQLEIAVNQSFNKRGNIDKARLAKNLSKINSLKYINAENEEVDIAENTEIKLTAKVKFKGNTFKINDEGKVSYKKEGTADIEDILNSPANYYGRYVTNYNSPYDAGITEVDGQLGRWQICLADDTNIYLIASNYITYEYTGKKNNVGFYNYDGQPTRMDFNGIYLQYNASSTKTDIPDILSKLDKQNIYHKWLSISSNQTRNYPSEKSVASMLDVDLWKGYNNTTYAKYAIGGPTLEMFCKSYNDTRTENASKLLEIYEDNSYGYTIKKRNEDPTDDLIGLNTGAVNTTVDDMYFKIRTYNNAYWIASTGIYNGNQVYHADYNGEVTTNAFSTGWSARGFRPLVCLNSNVHLVKNTDGETYSLELD